jgi:cold shock CspA family protein
VADNKQEKDQRKKGQVKFFNYDRGYGFIEKNDDDYFVHVTNIQDSDLLISDEMVEFRPVKSNKGLQALDVSRLNPPPLEKETGFVKDFFEEDGYGFIGREGKADVFVHLSDIEGVEDADAFDVYDKVSFDVRTNRDGRERAYRVELFENMDDDQDDREDE